MNLQDEIAIKITDLRISFGTRIIIDDLNLKIKKRSISTFIGRNGSGKSTLLRAIANFSPYKGQRTEGRIERKLEYGFVHQNYRESVLPWFTAKKNILINNSNSTSLKDRLREIGFYNQFDLNNYTYQLSGGQCQMVALSRALFSGKKLLILDEPFSSLDYEMQLKVAMNLREYSRKNDITIISVLHDIQLAMIFSDFCYLFDDNAFQLLDEVKVPSANRNSYKEFFKDEKINSILEKIISLTYEKNN